MAATYGFSPLCYVILLKGVLQLVPAVCLNILVKHFEGRGNLSMRAQWTIVAALYLAPTIGSLCRSRYDTCMVHFGSQDRASAVLACMRKSSQIVTYGPGGVRHRENRHVV